MHYLLALLRNEAGAEAENGPRSRLGAGRELPRSFGGGDGGLARLSALPRQRFGWACGNPTELGAEPNSASPNPPLPADGIIRTTAPLELAPAAGAAVTALQVKAFERLRPWAGVEMDLTVTVRPVNRWLPRCLPALLM